MKTLRWFLVLAVVALMLTVGAISVGAANSDPSSAPYVDNAIHSIGANVDTWYRFEYTGDHSQITVKLVDALHDGTNRGLSFQVYTPSQMQEWWKHDGIGAGSRSGDDLLWSGNAHESGTWMVKVMNANPSEMTFNLVVTGEKVSFVPPSEPANAAAAPSIGTTLENENPNNAIAVDENLKVIPANTTLWYRFPYSGTHEQAILKVIGGNKNLLRVHIHTPEQMKTWWNVTPVGQATPKEDDLIWSGNSEQAGMWYVEVINDNTAPVSFQLALQMIQRNVR